MDKGYSHKLTQKNVPETKKLYYDFVIIVGAKVLSRDEFDYRWQIRGLG